MRYLNKIVFINSANIPYEEVLLDGNIHFIGTQGVGKSTLLRAILFFYNVDKSGLGIRLQAKQKSFDEFYLPYPNSYIIYEVARENGPFFIVVFRKGVRAAFRIVDCAYDRSFFVESDGSVNYDWTEISRKIGSKVFKSNIIRANEELRNIIYGNKNAVVRELGRFSLLESVRYQNVPRTIQNIFLNQGLESEFIKRTIIDSMNFADDCIELNFYRDHLKDFRLHYDDIWKWFKTERDGRVKVRVAADKALDSFSAYEATQSAVERLCGQLRHARQRDDDELSVLGADIASQSVELSRRQAAIENLEKRYQGEHDLLVSEKGVVEHSLKEIRRKRQHYKSMGIEAIAARMEQEAAVKIRAGQLQRERDELTSLHRSVKERYDSMIAEVDRALEAHRAEVRERILEIERKELNQRNELDKWRSTAEDGLRATSDNDLNSLAASERELRASLQEHKISEQRVKAANPYSERFEELRQQEAEFSRQLEECKRRSAECASRSASLQSEADLKVKDLEAKRDRDSLLLEHERGNVLQELERISGLQERQNGSFIEWLEQNVQGWADSIGVMLDQDNVLYNTDLSPELVGGEESVVCGVRIDVSKVDRQLLTPEALRRQRAELETRIADIARREQAVRADFEAASEAVNKKLRKELAEVNAQMSEADGIIRIAPLRRQEAERRREALEKQLEIWRSSELAAIRAQIESVSAALAENNSKIEETRKRRDKDIKKIRSEYDSRRKAVEEEAKGDKGKWNAFITGKTEEACAEKERLRAAMNRELEGKGVDVERLRAVDMELQQMSEEQAYIEANRAIYIQWKNDCSECFATEPELLTKKKNISARLEALDGRYDNQRRAAAADIDRIRTSLGALRRKHEDMKKAIEAFDAFTESSSCPEEWQKARPKKTLEPLVELHEELRNQITNRLQLMERFKNAVNAFKSNFSAGNTFNFRVQLDTESDYMEFATNLNEFIVNNKIEEYRRRVSSQYAKIINRISQEMGQLGKHRAEIAATINEINRDFLEGNFVGAIKDIELRAVDNTDRLVVMFQNIKVFADENADNLGDSLNLFSTEADLSKINRQAVDRLMSLIELMDSNIKRDRLTLEDSFKLEFKVRENNNDTSWVERLSNVGSDGTDILVKAMVNIMLINVFKKKISRKFGDFRLHCMMDEIGKLHPNNVEGILRFANERNINLINSSPTAYNASAYRHTYELYKDSENMTHIRPLLTVN